MTTIERIHTIPLKEHIVPVTLWPSAYASHRLMIAAVPYANVEEHFAGVLTAHECYLIGGVPHVLLAPMMPMNLHVQKLEEQTDAAGQKPTEPFSNKPRRKRFVDCGSYDYAYAPPDSVSIADAARLTREQRHRQLDLGGAGAMMSHIEGRLKQLEAGK